MLKRILPLLLAFLMMASASAAGIEICYGNFEDRLTAVAASDRVSVTQLHHQWMNGYAVSTFNWTAEGRDYSCCIGGLSEELTEAQIKEIAGAVAANVVFELAGDSLVDAEKATNKLPVAYGTPVEEPDEVRENKPWGDSSQCWAGSLSDMLQITGWGGKAIDPETGAPFADEDTLFSCFTREFTNQGSYQSSGTVWFFSGVYERDNGMADLRREGSGCFLPDDQPPVSKAEGDELQDDFLPKTLEMLSGIGEGGVVGLDVQMADWQYPLKDDSGNYAFIDADKGCYVWQEFIFFDEGDEPFVKRRFVLDEQGGVVFTSDDASDRGVMEGLFLELDGSFYPVSADEFGSHSCTVTHVIDASEIDLTAPEQSYSGTHALTAIGWIRCVSDNDDVIALLIIDSDNDAHVYSPVAENASKQDRPNKYTLFYARESESSYLIDYPSIVLTDYYGREATIKGVTLLEAMQASAQDPAQ